MSAYDFLIDTYETERIKTLSVWSLFQSDDLEFRPAPKIRTPHEQMVHQCVSEHTWMINMLGIDSGLPPLPEAEGRLDFLRHYARASERRLAILREKPESWFAEGTTFFEVPRSRSWVLPGSGSSRQTTPPAGDSKETFTTASSSNWSGC